MSFWRLDSLLMLVWSCWEALLYATKGLSVHGIYQVVQGKAGFALCLGEQCMGWQCCLCMSDLCGNTSYIYTSVHLYI